MTPVDINEWLNQVGPTIRHGETIITKLTQPYGVGEGELRLLVQEAYHGGWVNEQVLGLILAYTQIDEDARTGETRYFIENDEDADLLRDLL